MKLKSVRYSIVEEQRDYVYHDNIGRKYDYEFIRKLWSDIQRDIPFLHAFFDDFIANETSDT
jgi:hypothetical protein